MSENDVAAEPAAVPKARKKKEPKPKPSPVDLGPVQVLRHTGLAEWQWNAGTAAGLIPPADCGGRWSVALADQVAARREEIVAPVGGFGHRVRGEPAGQFVGRWAQKRVCPLVPSGMNVCAVTIILACWSQDR